MRFQSHVPNFVEADPAIPNGEYTLDEILDHPWIKSWNTGQKDFAYYWSPNPGEWSRAVLMAQWTDEHDKLTWWVLGYMEEIPTSLPKWSPPK